MLVKYFGALTNPAMYGPLIAAFTVGGFGLSIPFWYKAGKHYNAHMQQKKKEENASLTDS
jgi:hypothetical protein